MIIPKNKLFKRKKGHSSAICEECGNEVRVRNIIKFKGKFLCNICKSKLKTSKAQSSATELYIGNARIPLKKALNKIYLVRSYNYGGRKCVVSFPSCLAEKKIKIQLVKEKKK